MPRLVTLPRFFSAALVAVTSLAAMAPNGAAAADPSGTWLTEDGRARVRTERCGPQDRHLCGYVVWARKPQDETGKPRTDSENPDIQKRKRPVLGHQMILGLRPDENRHYTGKIYNADNGKSYDVTIWSDAFEALSVQGCLLSVLCQTQTWKRVSDVVPGQLAGPTDGPSGPRADREWAKAPATTGSTGPHKLPSAPK